jgi:prepilin-type N-terminal cleavage/methylation domain-containing protein
MPTLIKSDRADRSSLLAQRNSQAGFSLVELLLVVTLMVILMVFVGFSLSGHKKLYKADDETLRITNVFREAAQLALTQRQPMRVEIDATNKTIRIVDENLSTASDDKEVRKVTLEPAVNLRVDVMPTNVTKPSPPNYPDATYTGTPKIWKIWFKRDGTVTDSANAILSSTLYIWEPNPTNNAQAKNKKLVRCITIFGTTGVIRLWKHDGTNFVAS